MYRRLMDVFHYDEEIHEIPKPVTDPMEVVKLVGLSSLEQIESIAVDNHGKGWVITKEGQALSLPSHYTVINRDVYFYDPSPSLQIDGITYVESELEAVYFGVSDYWLGYDN